MTWSGWHAGIPKQPHLTQSFRRSVSKGHRRKPRMERAGHETPAESLTEAQAALAQLGSSLVGQVQESANFHT